MRQVVFQGIFIGLVSLGIIQTVSAMGRELPELQTVPKVELSRYLGRWYEIARFEQRFQKGCVGVTATYSQRPDGKIDVLNECKLYRLDGEHKLAQGWAKVADHKTNSKLKVTFFWPFFGDYWIIELGENYEYAVVGAPGRDYLWILSRTPEMDEAVYDGLVEKIKTKHLFDVTKLQKTLQYKNFEVQ